MMKSIMIRSPITALIISAYGSGVVLSGISPAYGRDYFDPALLSLGGGNTSITDLKAFEHAGQNPPGEYLVSVVVNQSDFGLRNIKFISGGNGNIQPELTPDLLADLGVNTQVLPSFAGLAGNQPVTNLTKLIPDARIHFDFQQQRLELSIPQIAMKSSAREAVDPKLWDQGIPAILLDYTLNGSRTTQDGTFGQPNSEQRSLYLGLRGGVNLQAWRLRSDMTYTRSESLLDNSETQRYRHNQFTNTYIQRDIQALRSDILVGENNTGSDVFDSIPFRGVKLSSSEDMLPVSLRGFAPDISGIAQTNAQVTVSQNGNVMYQTYVAPGPFRIDDLFQSGQGGDLTITITESDGRVRTWTQAFSSLPVMVRPNGLKYEVTTGRYNGGITRGSRKADFMLGTLVYGLPHNITLYGGSTLAKDYNAFVAGSGVSLGYLGALSLDITRSSAQINGRQHSGQSYRMRYAKSLLDTGTSVDLTAYRYSTSGYYSFADFNNFGYELSEDMRPWVLARQRSDFQVRLSQQLGNFGSLYLSGSRSDYWGNEQVNNTLSMGYNTAYKGVSLGVAYSVDRIKSDGNWPQNRQLALNVQVPLSLFTARSAAQHSYANYQMSHSSDGRVRSQAGLTGTALDDRLSYSLLQGWSNGNGTGDDASTMNLGWQGSKGMSNLGYSQGSNSSSLNISTNGGVLVHSDGVTLSQQLGNSIALVKAPGAGSVNVTNGGVKTDSRGFAVVPYLSQYQSNSISLDPSTLPDTVDLTQSSVNVYPTKGAVVEAKFATRRGFQALLTLTNGGKVMPFGTMVALIGEDNINSIVGDAGQVYLSGLPEKGMLTAIWGEGQSCRIPFNLAKASTSKNNPVRMLNTQCEKIK